MQVATRPILSATLVGVSFLAILAGGQAKGSEPPSADAERLSGTWIFDVASQRDASRLPQVWSSTLNVSKDGFALTKFMGLANDWKGTFVLSAAANPKTIDVKIDELDLSAAGAPAKIPAGTVPGIYRLEGDRLRLSVAGEIGGKRPTNFETTNNAIHIQLVRAPENFKGFPKDIGIKVNGPDGKPSAAIVTGFMSLREGPAGNGAKPEWTYHDSVKTAADGTAKVPYEKLGKSPLVVRDPDKKHMAITLVSPASLVNGNVNVTLKPECRVVGAIKCDQLNEVGKATGWTNVYLMQDGQRVADCYSTNGKFEFAAPPGIYTLYAYGSDVLGKRVTVTVPPDRNELAVDPIQLAASKLVLLQGCPAPELEDVVGWKGDKIKLADLRGKYVLLEFWGYWCGPCVRSMPVIIELHEKFADKGLAIVGIHVDGGGDVETASQLDNKIAGYKKTLWSGKDLPFPIALTSGKHTEGNDATPAGPAAQYGVNSFPTTILIDRDGKVVGKFRAKDAKHAAAEVEKLLGMK